MKTYHEMTESVLQRAQVEAVAQKRRRRNSIAITTSGVCLVLLLTILGVGLKQTPAVVPTLPSEMLMNPVDTTGTSQPTEQQVAVKVTYLSDIYGQTTLKLVSPDVSIPLNSVIRVRDTRGLTEEEFEKAREEEIALGEEMRLDGAGQVVTWEYPGAIATIVHNGLISLDFSDCPTLSNVEIKTTETGIINMTRRSDGTQPIRDPDTVHWKGVQEIGLGWSISGELAVALHKDPTVPLSSIRDTITVMINYENGTTETLIFDITIDDLGKIFVTQRGIQNFTA